MFSSHNAYFTQLPKLRVRTDVVSFHLDHLFELSPLAQFVTLQLVVVHHFLTRRNHHFFLMDLSVQHYLFRSHLDRRRVHVLHPRRLHQEVVPVDISLRRFKHLLIYILLITFSLLLLFTLLFYLISKIWNYKLNFLVLILIYM